MKNKRVLVLVIVALLTPIMLACRIGDLVSSLLATETPVPTRTPRSTFTPLPTLTVTTEPTNLPTSTPTRTLTPRVAPTLTRTSVPAKTTTAPTAPQPPKYPWVVKGDPVCTHSGQAFVEGLVLRDPNDTFSGENSVLVRMSASPGGAAAGPDYTTQPHYLKDLRFDGNYDGYFSFIVNAAGPAPGQVRYIWVVDPARNPLSDPGAARATFDAGQKDDSCWNVQIIFVKQ